MIYIYRTLWLLFYVPIFIIELLLSVISLPIMFIAFVISYIITGDIYNIPEIFIPGRLAILLDYWYKDLEPELN